MATKNQEFQQFARTSESGQPVPTPDDDEGKELTCDRFGRLWVRVSGGGPTGDQPFVGAGSDYIHNVSARVIEPLEVQQHSLDRATDSDVVDLTAKVSPGRLYQAYAVVDTPAEALWLQVHNTLGTPVLGGSPVLSCPLTTCCGSTVVSAAAKLDVGAFGLYLSLGITLAISTQGAEFDPPGLVQSVLTGLYR